MSTSDKISASGAQHNPIPADAEHPAEKPQGYESDFLRAKEAEPMHAQGDHVCFYRLTRKYTDTDESLPEPSKEVSDVLYYTQQMGHHTGIIDCFEKRIDISLDDYRAIIATIADEKAQFKLSGVMRFGEVEVQKEHSIMLIPALQQSIAHLDVYNMEKTHMPLSKDQIVEESNMLKLFLEVRDIPSVYVMIRRMPA